MKCRHFFLAADGAEIQFSSNGIVELNQVKDI